MRFNHELGAKAQDTVTGVIGEITARCEYPHQPPEYLIEWCDKSGYAVTKWLTEERLQTVEE